MATTTRLDAAEIGVIAARILGARWRDAGFDRAEVVPEDDVYGEPALFVTIWLASGSPAIPVDLYESSLLAFRDALRTEGEDRYAYVHLGRPDDPVAEDDPDGRDR